MRTFDFSNFKNLYRLNMVSLSRHSQSQGLNKPKKKKALSLFRILIQTLGSGLILGLLYTPIFIFADNRSHLYMVYDRFVTFIFVMGFLQTFISFYATLYESKDLESLLPLPVTSLEIYLSKIMAVMTNSLIFILPIVIMTLVFNYLMDYPLVLNIVFNIYFGLVLSIFYIFINIVFMEVLSYSGILYKFRSSVITLINVLIQIGTIFFIFSGQTSLYNDQGQVASTSPQYLSALIDSHQDLSLFMVISLSLALVSVIGIILLGRNFVPHYQAIQSKKSGSKKKTSYKRKTSSLRRSVYLYKFRLINNNTVISISIVGSLFMAFVPFFSLIMEGLVDENFLVLMAIYLSIINTVYVLSLSRNIVSLDNNNFELIRTWPIDMGTYLIYNAQVSTIVTSGLGAIIIFIMGLVFGLGPGPIGLAIGSNLALTYGLSIGMVYKDYKNIYIGWHSEADLFTRVSKFRQFVQYTLMIFVASFAVGLLSLSSFFMGTYIWLVLGLGSLLAGLIAYIIYSDKLYYLST